MKTTTYEEKLKLAMANGNNDGASIGWGSTNASLGAAAVGDARNVKREAPAGQGDVIDASMPSVYGTILGAVTSGTQWPSFKVMVGVSKVVIPDGCVSTFKTSSGAVFQVATQRVPQAKANGEKVKMPRKIASDACVMVRIDGVVVIDIKDKKNGPNQRDLLLSDLVPGSKIKFDGVAHDYVYKAAGQAGSHEAYPERHDAYGTAVSIDYGDFAKGPSHPREKFETLFHALAYKSPGMHEQILDYVTDHVGTRTEAMAERAMLDRVSVADQMDGVFEKNGDVRIGVGKPWEEQLFSTEASVAWKVTSDEFRKSEVVANNILRTNVTSALVRSHYVPIVQFGIDPVNANKTHRATTGMSYKMQNETAPESIGGMHNVLDPTNPFQSSGTKTFTESTLRLAATKQRRREPTLNNPEPVGMKEDEIATKSMGSVAIDVASFTYTTRPATDADFNQPSILKTVDDTTVVVKQFLSSCKQGWFLDKFGVYDYFRLQMLLQVLVPYLPFAAFTNNWENVPTTDAIVAQPRAENGWISDHTIVDVATAVENCGIRVSKKFLDEFAVDDEKYFLTPPNPIQYVSEDRKGVAMPVKPPKLEVDGYTCMNGQSEIGIGRLKKLPEGSSGVNVFVVFADCDGDVAANVKINKDTAAGEEFLKAKYKDDLKAKLANVCAIFAVAERPKKRKAAAEPTA